MLQGSCALPSLWHISPSSSSCPYKNQVHTVFLVYLFCFSSFSLFRNSLPSLKSQVQSFQLLFEGATSWIWCPRAGLSSCWRQHITLPESHSISLLGLVQADIWRASQPQHIALLARVRCGSANCLTQFSPFISAGFHQHLTTANPTMQHQPSLDGRRFTDSFE